MPQKMIQSIYHFHSKEGINMNKIYKVIWSKAKHTYVVASEIAKGHTKGETTGRGLKKLAAAMLVAAALLSPSFAWAADPTVTVTDASNTPQTVYTKDGVDNTFATKGSLTTEATARANADSTLQTNIDNEAAACKAADTKLVEAVNSGLSLSNDNVLQKNTTSVGEDGTVTTSKEAATTLVMNKGGDNQITLSDKGIKVGLNSGVMDKDGFYAGGDTADAAKAALKADGSIKGADGKFAVDADGKVTAASGKIGNVEISSTGAVSGVTDMTASGTITGNKLTDGVASLQNGNLTTTGNINAHAIVATGDISGKAITGTSLNTQGGDINGGAITGTTITGTTGTFGSLTTTGNASVGGTLSSNGLINTGNVTTDTLTVNHNATVGGDLAVTGDITGKSLNVGTGAISGGQITGTGLDVGAGTIKTTGAVATGTLETTGNATIGGNLTVDKNLTVNGTFDAKTLSSTVDANNYTTINGGKTQSVNQKEDAATGETKASASTFDENGSNTWAKDDESIGKSTVTADGISQKLSDHGDNPQAYAERAMSQSTNNKYSMVDTVKDGDKTNVASQTASESSSVVSGKDGEKAYKSYITQNLKNILQKIEDGDGNVLTSTEQTETGIKSTATDGKNTASTNLSNEGFNTYATDGTNKTYTKQTAADIKNTAENGTISNTAKDLVNTASENMTNTVGKNLETTVGGEMKTTVTGNVTEDFKADLSTTVGGNKSETVTGTSTETVTGKKTENYNGGLETTVTGEEKHTVNGSQTNAITGDQTNTIGGSQTTTVTGDSSLTAENINNTARNKITNKALDVETDAASSIVSKVSNDYGSNTSTQLSYQTTEEMSQADGKTASYLRGAAEEKSQLIDGSKKTTIDTIAGQTNTNITDGTNTSNDLQKADQIASSVTDGTNTTVVNQDAGSLASSITDGTKVNNTNNTVDKSEQLIKASDTQYSATSKTATKMEDALVSGGSVIDVIKNLDDAANPFIGSAVTDGTNSTGVTQTAKDITNAAQNGTITNEAKDLVNTASENMTNNVGKDLTTTVGGEMKTTVTGKVTEDYKSDLSTKVGGDETHAVTGNQTTTVSGNRTVNVKGTETENFNAQVTSIKTDQKTSVGGNQTNIVAGNQQNTVSGSKTETVKGSVTEKYGSQATTVDGDQSTHVGGNQSNVVAGNQTNTISGSKTESVKGAVTETYGSQTTKVNGNQSNTVKGTLTETVTGDVTEDYKANLSTTVGGNQTTTVTGDSSLSAKNIINTASEKITNLTGDNTVTSDTDGTTFENKAHNTAVKEGTVTKTTISGNTITTGEAVMDYADVMKDLGVRGNAAVDGNTTLGKKGAETTLTVNSTSTFNKDVTMEENLGVRGTTTTDKLVVNNGAAVTGGTTTDTLKVTGSSEFDGKATFNDIVTMNKGLSVTGGVTADTVTAYSYKVGDKTYIDKDGINANNQVIRNVGQGNISEGSTDAVSGGQLYETNTRVSGLETRMGTVETRVDKLDGKIDKVGANAAAMANLHPLEFDEDSKWNVAAAVGSSGSETASAVGVFYRPNENVMVNASAAMGTGENMFGGGVSLRLGHGGNKAKEAQMKAAAAENKELRAKVDDLTARMDALLSVLNPNMSKDFPDVPENHWAYEAVSRLAGNGIVEGYEDGKYHGERQMTRYEMAEIIYNALSKGAKAEKKLVEEFRPELQARAAQKKA